MLSVVALHLRQSTRQAVGAALRFRRSGVPAMWVLGDQGIASLGNFISSIILARTLGLAELGMYGVMYELGLFLNSMQAAIVLFPMNVRGPLADDRARFAEIAGKALSYTLMLSLVLGAFMLCTGAVIGDPTVGMWAMVALVMFQIQETLRRSLIARMRYRAVVLGDAISYLGQATALYLLAATNMLTLGSAYQAFALTSALGALLQVWQVGPRVASPGETVRFAAGTWGLSRWVLFANLTNLFTGTLFYWNLAFWAGREMLGVAIGLMNVLRLANPLLLAFASVIVPTVARARGRGGFMAARRLLFGYGGFALSALTLLFAVPFVFPAWVLRIFYPHNAEQYLPYTHVLQVMLVTTLCVAAKDVLGAFFNAVEQPRLSFLGQAVYTVSIVLIGMPLTAWLGLQGLAWGGLFACSIVLVFSAILFHGLGRSASIARQRRNAGPPTDLETVGGAAT